MWDLAPQRVLDLILEVFMARLGRYWRFFVDLLEVGCWGVRDSGVKERKRGGKRKLKGGEELTPPASGVEGSSTPSQGTQFLEDLLKEQGNTMLTQVLGFKFSFYQPLAKDLKGVERVFEEAPRQLFLVAGILLREGLIRTLDLLPYVSWVDGG